MSRRISLSLTETELEHLKELLSSTINDADFIEYAPAAEKGAISRIHRKVLEAEYQRSRDAGGES